MSTTDTPSAWIPHDGGWTPLAAGAKCDTLHRDGSVTRDRTVYAGDRWAHLMTPCDIVAYRPLEPEPPNA